mgnify:CR=1 FL=1
MELTKQQALQKIKELTDYVKSIPEDDSSLQSVINKMGSRLVKWDIKILIEGRSIIVPLPSANSGWTLEAFEYVFKMKKEYPKTSVLHSHENAQLLLYPFGY